MRTVASVQSVTLNTRGTSVNTLNSNPNNVMLATMPSSTLNMDDVTHVMATGCGTKTRATKRSPTIVTPTTNSDVFAMLV